MEFVPFTLRCPSIFRKFKHTNKQTGSAGAQKESTNKNKSASAQIKSKDGTKDKTKRPVNTDIFTLTTKRTLESAKFHTDNQWAVRTNTNISEENKGSMSLDLRLCSMENQMDSSSIEKLNSILDMGKRRFVDYDPVNILNDFNTISYEDSNN